MPARRRRQPGCRALAAGAVAARWAAPGQAGAKSEHCAAARASALARAPPHIRGRLVATG